MDPFSRQVAGWSMLPHMQASLVTDALRMAWFMRHPAPGLIFHSDCCGQHCSRAFQDALASDGMLLSMRRKGAQRMQIVRVRPTASGDAQAVD